MPYHRSMADTSIPTTLADITPTMMTEGLRANGFDVEVGSIESERIAVGEGFLGELARLHLTYASGAGPAMCCQPVGAVSARSRCWAR